MNTYFYVAAALVIALAPLAVFFWWLYRREYGDGYSYRKIIKEVVREVIKSDIDNLSDRAVKAAAKSIENRAVKKMMDKMMEVSADA